MILLPDTSVWIEYLRGRPAYLDTFLEYGRRSQILAVEPVFGELQQGAKGEREIELIDRAWQSCLQIEANGLWLRAGEIARQNRLATRGIGLIDTFIWASAEKVDARIWTLDRKLASVLPSSLLFRPE